MSQLKQLFQKFGTMARTDITLRQLEELRNGLKSVDTSEVTSLAEAKQFLALLRKFREGTAEADKLHGENYPQLLSSLLSVGEDGLYSNNLRFIFELIQNVDDCEFPSAEDHVLDIHFNFNNDQIILRYNENGFTPFNVFAITGIAEAAKNVSSGKNEIGEKGIGFKSVFGVANKVLIRSGWFSFELHKSNFTIPIVNNQNSSYCTGTEMTLFVPLGKAQNIYREIKNQYCNKEALFIRNPLLFLNKLTTLKMYFDGYRSMEFYVSRMANVAQSKYFREEDVRISVDLHDYENGVNQEVVEEITCVRYSSTVTFSEEACKARYGDHTRIGSGGGKQMTLQAVFPRPEYLGTVDSGALYSFLPTQLRFHVPLVCHVPFKLDASREFVDPQEKNLWFAEASRYLSELLDYAYVDYAKIVKNDIVAYLPGRNRSLFADNNGKERCLSAQSAFRGEHFSKLPLFYTVDGHFSILEHVFCFAREENIFEPLRAYRLLDVSDELFLLPERPLRFSTGIRVEKNIYHRLFVRALSCPDKTPDLLSYLDDVDFRPTEEDFPESPFELTEEQIFYLMSCPNFANLFIAHAKKCLRAGKRPEYTVLASSLLPIQEALAMDFKPSEAPKSVEQYLLWCQGQCALMEINRDQFFPCHNALVLSRESPLDSFAAFCSAVDSKDTFSVRITLKKNSQRLNRLSESEEGSPEDYLRELQNSRLSVKEALGERQYLNYIDLILKSGSTRTRFLQELLQNADDCEYAPDVVPEFSWQQNQTTVVSEYNELGFTRGNIRSITSIGESTKNHLLNQNAEKIGEKGVGFKAVFAVASSVQIHSGKYHFLLSAKEPTIPRKLKRQHENVQGTRMEFTLKSDVSLPKYTEQELLELCLCLRNLRKIRINNTQITIEDSGDTRTVKVNESSHIFRRFTHSFSMDGNALKERENGLRSIAKNQRIVFYLPYNLSVRDYPLYCGLPTKHRVKIPLVIDAPFMLTTSREEIELGGHLWNDRIRKELYTALLAMMNELKKDLRHKVLRYVRFSSQSHGTYVVYACDLSDCSYLNSYDFLSDVRAADLLPTFDRSVFVSAESSSAYRYPSAINYLFASNRFGSVSPEAALNIPWGKSFDTTLDALGCRSASFQKVLLLLKEYAGEFMAISAFRKNLYSYLNNLPDLSESYQAKLKELPIIPVYSISGSQTDYIRWADGDIFVKKSRDRSEYNYYVLNEEELSKSDCEHILGVNINEMNAEWERGRFNDTLKALIRSGKKEEIYKHLLVEHAKGSFTKYQSQEILMGMKDLLPLKNQLGEIMTGNLFLCDEVTGWFQSNILLSISVHDECKSLARYLKYPPLSAIYYQDLPAIDTLTRDDIEDLTADYFVNREEILRNLFRKGQLSEELAAEYGLEYIMMKSCEEDTFLQFPEKPVMDFDMLRKHIRKLLQNPIKIVSVKVERTVRKGITPAGREFELDGKDARKQTLLIYTPHDAHGRCFCQMCHKVKPYEFMEVNNILPAPKYFFSQTRVALCLECSKRFESLRRSNAQRSIGGRDPFISAIIKTEIGSAGCVDVPLNEESIRFTATHLAEIKEILQALLK